MSIALLEKITTSAFPCLLHLPLMLVDCASGPSGRVGQLVKDPMLHSNSSIEHYPLLCVQ